MVNHLRKSPVKDGEANAHINFSPYKCLVNIPTFLPKLASKSPSPTLLLDLENTLVSVSVKKPLYFDHSFSLPHDTALKFSAEAYLTLRPGLSKFFEHACRYFEVVICSPTALAYADKILEKIFISTDGQFSNIQKLYREHYCVTNAGYVLDHFLLGRDIKRVCMVASEPLFSAFQPNNYLHISPFMGDRTDNELAYLWTNYLSKITKTLDIAEAIELCSHIT